MSKFTYALLGLFAVAPAQSQELNPSPYDWREQSIEPVNQIVVRGTFKVMVLTGTSEPKVTFQGPTEMMADATATVDDGVLTIAFKDHKPWSSNPGSRMSAVVHLPHLESVKVDHLPAHVDVMGNTTDSFAASINGAGRINVERLDATRVIASTGGSGSITIEGKADQALFATGGAGSIDGKRLRVDNASIAIGGAGSVHADVSDTADIAVNGAGRVEIVGGAQCNVQPDKRHKVECR